MKSKLTKEEELEILDQTRNLKKTLKQLSKNELIQLLLQQVNYAVEQQNVNKVLHAQLRAQATGDADAKQD